MTSRVPELIDALVAACRAAPGLADIAVADGPEISESNPPEWLMIGFDGDADSNFQAAQSVITWASPVSTDQEEQLQVTCAVFTSRGDTDVRAARARAYEIGGVLEQLLKADPSVGLRSLEVAIQATQLAQPQMAMGAQAQLVLTVAGRTFT